MTPIVETPVPHTWTACRICQAPLAPVLDLGPQYVSDFPHSAGTRPHAPVPLELLRCTRVTCGLVQLRHTTPRDWLYTQYWYQSGVNETMVAELADVVQQALARVEVQPHAVVMDIGANDGTLLAQYPLQGHPHLLRVAYEPAANLYALCRPHASVLFPSYFAAAVSPTAATRAHIVTSIAMFYDLDDPHAFVADVAKVLHPDGVWVIQQAYLPLMLANTDFPNICHEHLEYYHLAPLEALLAAHGLEVFDLELRPINGGSLRTYVRHARGAPIEPRVAEAREDERDLVTPQALATFAETAGRTAATLRKLLEAFHAAGTTVDLYAASTKANTLLQTCGIDATLVRQAWERSPAKIGRYAGTSGIPIVSEAEGRADPPDVLLVGAWTFREAFLAREAAFIKAGGTIVLPLPTLEVVQREGVSRVTLTEAGEVEAVPVVVLKEVAHEPAAGQGEPAPDHHA